MNLLFELNQMNQVLHSSLLNFANVLLDFDIFFHLLSYYLFYQQGAKTAPFELLKNSALFFTEPFHDLDPSA